MSKKSKTATKYDTEDADFSVPTQSTSSTPRQRFNRVAKEIQTINESSSDDDVTNLDISLNKTILHSILDNSHDNQNPEMSITSEQLEAILKKVLTRTNPPSSSSSNVPSLNTVQLNMNNFSFWSKKIRAAMKLMRIWIDPTKSIDQLSPEEREINEKAAQYVLTNIDENNMNQITTENEHCFITIWNLLRQFHEPRTATTLIDFYCSIRNLRHQAGENVRMHLLKLETQFEKLLDHEDKLPESHKIAIMLASVKDCPEFEQLFYSAKWLKREDLTLKLVKESIIAAQDSRNMDKNNSQQQTAHATRPFYKNHRRRPQDPQRGWQCSHCEMDNHTESNCFKKNRRQKQGKTFKKQSHATQDCENQEQEEVLNTAEAFFGESTGTKRHRFSPPARNLFPVKARLGPIENPNVIPRPSIAANMSESVLDIHDHATFSDSGKIHKTKTKNNLNKNFKFQNLTEDIKDESSLQLNSTQITLISKTPLNLNNEKSQNICNKHLRNNKILNYNTETKWIVDSGATIHMCNQNQFLTNYTIKEGHFVTISDGSQVPIEGYGNLIFNIIGDDKLHHKFILENVAHVPKLSVNLISVRELTKLNVKILFVNDICKIVHSDGSIPFAHLTNSLFTMKISHECFKNQQINKSNLCIHQWHRKLSHRNLDHIRRIKETLQLKIEKCNCLDECIDCLKGKINAPPFPKISEKPKLPRSIITSDLCGQIRTQSLGGAKYFITLIDASTDYTEVITLKHKSESCTAIRNFMEKCKTQFGHYPKVFRSDRGGEFLSTNLQNFLREKGIEFQCTVPNTPQQNGISERKNRTLVEAIRTLLISKNLPHYLWAEALHHANNTFNAIPKAGKQYSPKEEYYGKRIPFEFVEFGTQVIFHSNEQNRSKLDPKGAQGIFVGIDHNSKGYRIFWNGKILIKRILKFLQSTAKHDSMTIEQLDTDKIISESFPVDKLRRSERLRLQKSNIVSLPTVFFEPKTFKQAISCPDKDKWALAMEKELQTIENNNTWSLVELPKDREAVGCKWVYKIKKGIDDDTKYKARLVAQGFTQKYGVDYDEVFAPVTRSSTFRTLLAVASFQGLLVRQYDVKSAFLNGTLNEEIYMKSPPGKEKTTKVLRLHKSLYGLKQAARVWNQTLHKAMTDEHFIQSKFDECLYIYKNKSDVCYAIVHVDDFIFSSNSISVIESKTNALNKSFELKCLGDVQNYLSIEVSKDKNGIYSISQTSYIENVASQFGLTESKGSKYPIDPGYHKLEDEKELDSNETYRKLIGMLLYISTNSRPDISAAVGILSQRVSRPRELDYVEALRIVKYLISTKHERLYMLSSSNVTPLTAFSDSDWAEDRETRKSISGIICKVFGASVSWSSRKQDIVSTSTTESEFYALAEAVKEVQWLRNILIDLQIDVPQPIIIHSDNQSTIKLIENSKFSARTKHIDVRLHFVRDCVYTGKIILEYCPSEDNVADLLTKPLAGVKIKHLRNLAELKNLNFV